MTQRLNLCTHSAGLLDVRIQRLLDNKYPEGVNQLNVDLHLLSWRIFSPSSRGRLQEAISHVAILLPLFYDSGVEWFLFGTSTLSGTLMGIRCDDTFMTTKCILADYLQFYCK